MVTIKPNQELVVQTEQEVELVKLTPAQHLDQSILYYFLSGLIYGWLKGSPLKQAVRMGLSVSSRNYTERNNGI